MRAGVRFRAGNLIDPGFLADEPAYDAVFCRNLFIYLTPEARRTATAALERLLAPGGVAYMGHAEPLGLADGRFKPLPPPQAFVFGRAEQRAVVEKPPMPFFAVRTPKAHGPLAVGVPPATPTPPPKPAPPDLLAAARAAADRGDPARAAALAEQHLAAHGPSAAGFSLLGVARGMAGDPAAAEAAFTRALFLDPRHYDALVHLLALAEARGDAAAAANYRRRADTAHRQQEAGR
ncbi:MAG: CheR family methyltransferase [Gemmataceae bacterium]